FCDRSSARIEPDTSTAIMIAMPSRRIRAFLSPARGPESAITSETTASATSASGSHAIRVRQVWPPAGSARSDENTTPPAPPPAGSPTRAPARPGAARTAPTGSRARRRTSSGGPPSLREPQPRVLDEAARRGERGERLLGVGPVARELDAVAALEERRQEPPV